MRRRVLLGAALGLLLGAVGLLFSAGATKTAGDRPAPPSPAPSAPESATLSLDFVGDIMAHPVNYTKSPYSAIYAAVAPLFHSADLTFANLEFTIDPMLPYSGWPWFNVHPEYVKAAIDAGINVFSNANNHIADHGASGIRSTFGVMQAFALLDGTAFSGIRASEEESMAPVTIERKGWRIGFLAITEFLNQGRRSDLVNVVDYRSPEAREAFLAYLREQAKRYDLFVLSVHGGIEYDPEPEPAKVSFFRSVLEAGVNIIWSQHPHVLEPWQLPEVEGSRRLVIYSNGNFISGQTSRIDPSHPEAARAATGDSAIFQVRVARVDGKVSVVSVDPLLISNYKNPEGEMVVQPLAQLAGADLNPPWDAYYRYRYAAMSRLVGAETAAGAPQ